MHRVRNLSVTTCNPHCGSNLPEDCLFTFSVSHSFLFLTPSFTFSFSFLQPLFLSTFFCAVLFYSFFTVFSLFPLSRQSAVSFMFCVSSHCISLSLSLSISQFLQPQTSSVVLTLRWSRQPSILVALPYTNRSVNTIGSEELKSLIHELRATLFLLSALSASCATPHFWRNMQPVLQIWVLSVYVSQVRFVLCTVPALLSNK